MLKHIVDVLKEVFWLKPTKNITPRKRVKSRKKLARKPIKAVIPVKSIFEPKVRKPKKSDLDPALKPIGQITHYFERINVAVVKIGQGTVLIGDRLTIVSKNHKFVQKIWSMQIESQDVKVAKKGQLIGIKVDKAVVVGDIVYK